MSEFDDIRPYNDDEVETVLSRLIGDNELIDLILSRVSPRLHRWLPWLGRFIARLKLKRMCSSVHSRRELHDVLFGATRKLLSGSSDGYSYSGIEQLRSAATFLFMSNHRDIAMDPVVLNVALKEAGRQTVRIAIGDNLLMKPWVSDLMRVNGSFIVKRSLSGRREKLEALIKLSRYIRHSIQQDGESVWIAQREGRAKDGYDETETALLKMLTLSKEKTQSFGEAIGELHLVPVAISYEYDPCDADKARELYIRQSGATYTKQPDEDLQSIYKGMFGYKGRIHIAFGEPVGSDFNDDEKLAAEIDRQIHTLYRIFPSNIVAYELSGKTDGLQELRALWPDEDWRLHERNFHARLETVPAEHRQIFTSGYAAPVISRLNARP